MSGFFSLGGAFGIGKDEEQQQHDQNQEQEDSVITPNSLYLFKNEEIYSKGFELWQQYYQLHQHRQQHHHHQPPPHYDLGVAGRRRSITGGVDDLCLNSSSNNNNNNSSNNNSLYASSWSFSGRSAAGSGDGVKVMRQAGYAIGGGDHGGGGSSSGGGMNCQDCGNQAKKDCQHMRCRTCCKSRGFQCQTHIKSTWVPAAKRRERQQQLASLTQQQQQQQNLGNQQLSLMMRGGGSGGAAGAGAGGGGIDQNPKRLREDHQLITTAGGGAAVVVNLPSTHHQHTSSGLAMGHFPAELSSPAVFRCVRVSAMDEAEEQLAYQTAVNIGGHVFKGILYDHGPEGGYNHPGGGGDTSSAGGTQHQQLNLITSGTMGIASATATASASITTTVNPNVATIDPSSIYPTPLNAFMAGTQFFPPPRS